MTLAYVFWHWKQASVDRAEYERRQAAFHAALAAAPSDGFVASLSVSVTAAPWAAQGGEAYEDWYLVRDWRAIGALNEAAVSASRAAPHDAAAAARSAWPVGLTARHAAPRSAHCPLVRQARRDALRRAVSPALAVGGFFARHSLDAADDAGPGARILPPRTGSRRAACSPRSARAS